MVSSAFLGGFLNGLNQSIQQGFRLRIEKKELEQRKTEADNRTKQLEATLQDMQLRQGFQGRSEERQLQAIEGRQAEDIVETRLQMLDVRERELLSEQQRLGVSATPEQQARFRVGLDDIGSERKRILAENQLRLAGGVPSGEAAAGETPTAPTTERPVDSRVAELASTIRTETEGKILSDPTVLEQTEDGVFKVSLEDDARRLRREFPGQRFQSTQAAIGAEGFEGFRLARDLPNRLPRLNSQLPAEVQVGFSEAFLAEEQVFADLDPKEQKPENRPKVTKDSFVLQFGEGQSVADFVTRNDRLDRVNLATVSRGLRDLRTVAPSIAETSSGPLFERAFEQVASEVPNVLSQAIQQDILSRVGPRSTELSVNPEAGDPETVSRLQEFLSEVRLLGDAADVDAEGSVPFQIETPSPDDVGRNFGEVAARAVRDFRAAETRQTIDESVDVMQQSLRSLDLALSSEGILEPQDSTAIFVPLMATLRDGLGARKLAGAGLDGTTISHILRITDHLQPEQRKTVTDALIRLHNPPSDAIFSLPPR